MQNRCRKALTLKKLQNDIGEQKLAYSASSLRRVPSTWRIPRGYFETACSLSHLSAAPRGWALIANFSSDQFTGFHGIVIPGTLHDSPYVLDGLLEHETSLVPKELMTDTAGYSDLVFGLFWLLGYQFNPRLADLGESRFWRINRAANYGTLDGLARQRINTKLIAQNWDDFLRVAGSLKMGTISGSELIRSLQRGSKKSMLARAIGELGRIPKTLHLLAYIDDENFRRRILTQLNRGEGRHSLARKCFFGQRGELRQHYREGQEDQLGALGLVVNALILWNTSYMDAALNYLKSQGFETSRRIWRDCHHCGVDTSTSLGGTTSP